MLGQLQNLILIICSLLVYNSIVLCFTPIETGTIKLPIPIPQTYNFSLKSTSQTLKGAKLITSMTEVYFPVQLKFQWTYTLNQQKSRIQLKFNYQRAKVKSLSIDYIVCKDAWVAVINMTDFQWHLNYETQLKLPPWQHLLLFLNGFSRLDLTGNVTYSYFKSDVSMYTIHYMNPKNHHQGWGDNFLLYTAVTMPWVPCKNCKTIENSKLSDDYILDQDPKVELFYGIKGVLADAFKGQFLTSGNSVKFDIDEPLSYFPQQTKYAIVAIPYIPTLNFMDNRQHKHYNNYISQTRQQQPFQRIQIVIVLIIIIALIIIVYYFFYRKTNKLTLTQQRQSNIELHQQNPSMNLGITPQLSKNLDKITEQDPQKQISKPNIQQPQ